MKCQKWSKVNVSRYADRSVYVWSWKEQEKCVHSFQVSHKLSDQILGLLIKDHHYKNIYNLWKYSVWVRIVYSENIDIYHNLEKYNRREKMSLRNTKGCTFCTSP